eukprot:m.161543 g.161543  ORF g.161543 m.161543 type:complete len:190 (-) comp31242_c0_seq5:446-1015(-)
MATKWAGAFDCKVCRRKRLIASEFSKRQVEKSRADATFQLTCKVCVENENEAERNSKAKSASTDDSSELHKCAACEQELGVSRFNKTQLRNKGPGKQRCMECVATAEKNEALKLTQNQQDKLKNLRQDAKRAEVVGSVGDKLTTAAKACAFEAELVGGLKPMIIGRGRGGRWSARGRGAGRGRGARGRK